jgi:hypothetical protein
MVRVSHLRMPPMLPNVCYQKKTMKPTTLRGLLYVIVLFLTPFGDKILPVLWANQWPTPQALIATSVMGIIAASIGLRAFLDGSLERSKSGNTQFIAK